MVLMCSRKKPIIEPPPFADFIAVAADLVGDVTVDHFAEPRSQLSVPHVSKLHDCRGYTIIMFHHFAFNIASRMAATKLKQIS